LALTPLQAMRIAIEQAARGAGFVSPNPLVGCAILDRHGELIGQGYHERVGLAHAEVNAVNSVRDPARLDGAHVFVTLEPCAHHGRTPPCAEFLAKLPIAAVTYGLEDPNPRVAGQGAAILRASGKTVAAFEGLQDELEDLAEAFLLNMRSGRPFVAVKVAASLDGRIALAGGASRWITGPPARAHVHHLRGCYDVVLTGAGTILKDDPRLDARVPRFASRPNRLVILDQRGELAGPGGQMAFVAGRSPDQIWLVTQAKVAVPWARNLVIPVAGGDFVLADLLSALWTEGLRSVFVEAGSRTVSSFLAAGLVDRLFVFLAPKLLGAGMGWTDGLKIPDMTSVPVAKRYGIQRVGEDLLISARL